MSVTVPTQALQEAKLWGLARPNVAFVGRGVRYVNGRRTTEEIISIGVKEKQPLTTVRANDAAPRTFGGVPTDVVQVGKVKAGAATAREVGSQEFTQRRRPCEAGYSIGHGQVTAGTLGMWVKRTGSDDWFLISNNHVLAASGDATRGDPIRQPGRADGGTFPADFFATLVDFVPIVFEKNGKKGSRASELAARAYWASVKAVGDLGPRLTGCQNRVAVAMPAAVLEAAAQAGANLVDLAIGKPRSQDFVKAIIHQIGTVTGTTDAALSMPVMKSGRTTELTIGIVDVVDAAVRVDYGNGTAMFDGQVVVRSRNNRPFSAGGDSGSLIVTDPERKATALLFAGGDNITIGNPIAAVMAAFGGLRVA